MKILQAKNEISLIPLKDMVVFPNMIVPFFVGRKRSIRAVEEAMSRGKLVFLATQKQNSKEDPTQDEIYSVGTIARILQMLKLPDGTVRLLVEGNERANIVRYIDKKDHYRVQLQPIKEDTEVTPQISALMRTVMKEFNRYASLYKKIPQEIVSGITKAEHPDKLANLISANVQLKLEKKIEILSQQEIRRRLETLVTILVEESEVLDLEHQINAKVRKKLEKSQRNFFLHEQLKEIQKELGNEPEDSSGVKELEEKLNAKGLPEEALAKCRKDLRRLSRMQPIAPESAVLRTYLEWITDLPWTELTQEIKDIELARQILNEDHYDLKKVKERVLDFIAVRLLNKGQVKGPILCFVGPPGTGKTSLGRSVARALGRKFVRISLGGVRDEAEIRGHRRTYVGALPGKIIQSMKKAGTRNPVFLLDEIDKMSSDFRGDPASALLEVLDPEQNSTFMDHYIEVQYDLSEVMFITTANSVHNILPPLRDRMEIIQIPGYTEFEKLKIAEVFLIPKQRGENGLDWVDLRFQRPALLKLIRNYTMESGVRGLERNIAAVMRKIARRAVKKGLSESPVPPAPAAGIQDQSPLPPTPEAGTQDNPPLPPIPGTGIQDKSLVSRSFRAVITPKKISDFLGKETFQDKLLNRQAKPGLAYGLAWTEIGGMLLPVEVALLEGKGELILTGSLGEVMKESAQTALSFLRSSAGQLNIPAAFNKNKDIHIHVPEGAIPKDGPSAGITITAALFSAVRALPIASWLAMTGEITLTGRLLPVGGVKEKVLAAHRNRMTQVLLPEMNRKDVDELPKEVLSSMAFEFADSIREALLVLFPPEMEDKGCLKVRVKDKVNIARSP